LPKYEDFIHNVITYAIYIFIMIAATQDEIKQHDCQPLSRIKEKPITDLINQLDIAEGLKELLNKSFTQNAARYTSIEIG
jgi:hypothetical protein